jgi:hypothetical protein
MTAPHELRPVAMICKRVRNDVKMLDRAIGHQQPVFEIEISFVVRGDCGDEAEDCGAGL